MCKKMIALVVATSLVLTGCSFLELNLSDGTSDSAFVSMESEPYLNYEVPTSLPHILVDQLGYLPHSTKGVFFYGTTLPNKFDLIDEATGQTVYTGLTEKKGHNDELGTDVAYGEFSEFISPGIYYVEADYLGRSFTFEIGEKIYDELFKEACKTYYYNRCGMTLTEKYAGDNAHNACHTAKAVLREDMTVTLDVTGGWHQDSSGSKDIISSSKTLGNMLLAYEIFPAAFTDEVGIPESGNGIPDILDEAKYEIDWLLKMQNAETGAVYSKLTVAENVEKKTTVMYVENADIDSARAFAFALAKFSYLYQNWDLDYAKMCLKAADRAWKYAILNEGAEDKLSQIKAAAAAEIYRASGSKECEVCLNEFLENKQYLEYADELSFYACVTYINTKQKVNAKYCEEIVKDIMKRAEDISEESRTSMFLVPGDETPDSNVALLENMINMTLVDHIIANHEYDTIIENYLHYFLGRNEKSITFLDNVGSYSYKEVNETLGLMKQFDVDAKLIFMLSKIVSLDGFVEE